MPPILNRKNFRIKLILLISPVFLLVSIISRSYLMKINTASFEKEREYYQALVRAGAVRLSEFFNFTERDLIMLASTEVIKTGPGSEARARMAILFQSYQDRGIPVGALLRTNREGIVIWATNFLGDRSGEGDFLGDRNYFIWAKEQASAQQVITNQPIIARGGAMKGKVVIVKATPILINDQFDGVLAVIYSAEELVNRFLGPLSYGSETKTYLITEEGFAIEENNLGSLNNIFDLVDKEKTRQFLGQLLEQSCEEEGSALINDSLKSPFMDSNHLISYYPVTGLGKSDWALWLYTPIKGITEKYRAIGIFYYSQFIAVSILFMFLVAILLAAIRTTEKRAFIDGFRNGRDRSSGEN